MYFLNKAKIDICAWKMVKVISDHDSLHISESFLQDSELH